MKIAKISSLKHYIRWAQRERLNAKKKFATFGMSEIVCKAKIELL